MIRILRAADREEERWRNDGGSSFPVAIEPQGATQQHFDWRISLARIDRSGPFSSFPGIDRSLAPLDSDGLVLWKDGQRIETETGKTVVFAGEESVEAKISGAPVLVINVMTERRRTSHLIARVTGTAEFEIGCLADYLYLLAFTPGHAESLGHFGSKDCIALERNDQAIIRMDQPKFELFAISIWYS